jgi:hypothetical protein
MTLLYLTYRVLELVKAVFAYIGTYKCPVTRWNQGVVSCVSGRSKTSLGSQEIVCIEEYSLTYNIPQFVRSLPFFWCGIGSAFHRASEVESKCRYMSKGGRMGTVLGSYYMIVTILASERLERAKCIGGKTENGRCGCHENHKPTAHLEVHDDLIEQVIVG